MSFVGDQYHLQYPLVPAKPERSAKFVESIQPDVASNIFRHGRDTFVKLAKALGATFVLPISAVGAVAEAGLYATANILTLPPVVLSKSASIINKTRTKTFATLAGKADDSMAA